MKPHDLPEAASAFANRLRGILARVVDLTNPFDVLRVPSFREVRVRASEYRPLVEDALLDDALEDSCKEIAVIALQRLPEEDYISFAEYVVDRHSEGRMSDYVAGCVLFPDPRWCVCLESSYADKRVRRLFRKYVERVPRERESVAHLLSGRTWANTLKMRRTGAMPVWGDDQFSK